MLQLDHVNETLCHLLWEMDGRRVMDPGDSQVQRNASKEAKRTRRLHIRWDHPDWTSMDRIEFSLSPDSYDDSDFDYPDLLSCEAEFLGRRLGRAENRRNLIREFLRRCE
ncbi:uncharacterized protein B0T15DRAFT_543447 [Chaetomium strumarium]|uniref:Uncharacterized protein n=1 Tax=Chaetomium strumarium TaxID=1170767 RepID=A0AAJ0GMS6_9PEZI|nr:hypothetical protein B0T15DRAFT_543447 [Chaetomium strumarium]